MITNSTAYFNLMHERALASSLMRVLSCWGQRIPLWRHRPKTPLTVRGLTLGSADAAHVHANVAGPRAQGVRQPALGLSATGRVPQPCLLPVACSLPLSGLTVSVAWPNCSSRAVCLGQQGAAIRTESCFVQKLEVKVGHHRSTCLTAGEP